MSPPPSSSAPATEAAALPAPPCADHVRWFKEEVYPHDAQLKAFLRGRFPTVRDVEDIAQESHFRTWRSHLHTPITSAKAFLFRIASNLAINRIRRDKVSPLEDGRELADLRVLDTAPNAADACVTRDTMEILADALSALPDRAREVLLCKLHGLTHREIAEHLGIGERAVEKTAARGLSRVEAYLRAHGIEESVG